MPLMRDLWMSSGSTFWGRLFSGRDISWDRKGAFSAHRRAQQLFCDRQDRVRPTTDAPCYGPMHLNLRQVPASAHEGWILEQGVSREDPVGWLMLPSRVQKWWVPQLGMLMEEAQTRPQKESTVIELQAKGRTTISASLLTHWWGSAPASKGTRKGSW